MEELIDKANLAIELDEIKKEIKAAGIKLNKKCDWFPAYVYGVVYNGLSITGISQLLSISRNTIHINLTQKMKDFVLEQKEQRIVHFKQKTYQLIGKSIKTLEDLIENADSDNTKLRAAELILKKFDIISDNQKIELSGKIDLPTINIVTEKEK